MILAQLIQGKAREQSIATATPATFATQEGGKGQTVATVATVAVAKSPQGQSASPAKIGAGDTATASRWWLIHYPDRDPVEVACCPEATHADILERHPDAVAAEPFTPTIRQPSAPLTAERGNGNPGMAGTDRGNRPGDHCRSDRPVPAGCGCAGLLHRAGGGGQLPKNRADAASDDDRRTCDQCANLIARRCQAAKRGEIVASRNYEPIRDLPRRCEGYAPGADDPDRRHGRERWPGLIQKGGE